ncbi:MAG: hypothetical protein EOO96_21715 [Pedobacter sp.]|nr:MAG: hypothetical protein EOO96_21715 [Pedobacter sp.]
MNIYQKNGVIVLLLIIGFVASIAYGYGFRNFINQPSFTAKDVEYKMLTEGVKSDKYSVSPLFKSEHRIDLSVPYFFRERKNIIFIGNYGDKSEHSFYKIDSLGNLVDSIKFGKNYSTTIFGEYILQNTGYSSWIIDGDTTRKNYKEFNADADWSEEKVEDEFDRLKQKAKDVFYFKYERLWDYNDPRKESKIDKAVFLIDGKWHALYGKNLYVNLDDLPDNTLTNLITNSRNFDKPNPIAYVADFRKINRVKKDTWDGLAYINLFYKTDTIKIKTKMAQNEKPKNDQQKYPAYNMGYYKPEDLPYAIIAHDYVYYIIKTKK